MFREARRCRRSADSIMERQHDNFRHRALPRARRCERQEAHGLTVRAVTSSASDHQHGARLLRVKDRRVMDRGRCLLTATPSECGALPLLGYRRCATGSIAVGSTEGYAPALSCSARHRCIEREGRKAHGQVQSINGVMAAQRRSSACVPLDLTSFVWPPGGGRNL